MNDATLTLGILTLLAVVWYAWEARRTADAAVEQAEGVQKPCLVVVQPPDTTEDAILEGMNASVLGEVTVRFQNIGNGPAVNIRFRFRSKSRTAGPLGMAEAPEAAPVAPKGEGDTNHPASALDPLEEVVLDYDSLSGTRYRSRAVIEARRWVREFRFSKLTGDEPDPPSIVAPR